LRVLVALSRADDLFQDAELDLILCYVVDAAARAGIASDDADRRALRTYLSHQRPAAELLSECLTRLDTAAIAEKHALLETAQAILTVSNAHGADALDMMNRIRAHLGQRQIGDGSPARTKVDDVLSGIVVEKAVYKPRTSAQGLGHITVSPCLPKE
jgi:nucleotide-binding universal stress UspA family protein